MTRIPREILTLARRHHERLLALEGRQRQRAAAIFEGARGLIRSRIEALGNPRGYASRQAQIALILSRVTAEASEQELEGLILEATANALALGHIDSLAELGAWARVREGSAVRPRLGPLMQLDSGALVEHYASSIQTYGRALAAGIRNAVQQNLASVGGPDALIAIVEEQASIQRWRADRIVRTETFNAYNACAHQTLVTARRTYAPGLKKTVIVTLDSRTGEDSKALVGAVLELEELFVDGKGRRYLHPPGRPNDREKEIPWLPPLEDQQLELDFAAGDAPAQDFVGQVTLDMWRRRSQPGAQRPTLDSQVERLITLSDQRV